MIKLARKSTSRVSVWRTETVVQYRRTPQEPAEHVIAKWDPYRCRANVSDYDKEEQDSRLIVLEHPCPALATAESQQVQRLVDILRPCPFLRYTQCNIISVMKIVYTLPTHCYTYIVYRIINKYNVELTSITRFPSLKPIILQNSPKQERLDSRTRGSGSLVPHKNPLTSKLLYLGVISPTNL